MRIKAKTKGIIKIVALLLAGLCALGAIGFGIAKLVQFLQTDYEKVSPKWEVGNLGTDGKYVEDECAIYTKDAFQSDGLIITPAFDNNIQYKVYYYDEVGNFLESTDKLDNKYEGDKVDAYARIVIIPENDEDGKIGLFEKGKYADQLTIEVLKDQDNYFNVFGFGVGKVESLKDINFELGYFKSSGDTYTYVDSDTYCMTNNLIEVKPGDSIYFDFSDVNTSFTKEYYTITLYEFNLDDGMKFVKQTFATASSSNLDAVATVSEGVTHVIVQFDGRDSTGSTVQHKITDADMKILKDCLIVE